MTQHQHWTFHIKLPWQYIVVTIWVLFLFLRCRWKNTGIYHKPSFEILYISLLDTCIQQKFNSHSHLHFFGGFGILIGRVKWKNHVHFDSIYPHKSEKSREISIIDIKGTNYENESYFNCGPQSVLDMKLYLITKNMIYPRF